MPGVEARAARLNGSESAAMASAARVNESFTDMNRTMGLPGLAVSPPENTRHVPLYR
jgi:hypothetical protein